MGELFYLFVVPATIAGLWIAWETGSAVGMVAVAVLGLAAMTTYFFATQRIRREAHFFVLADRPPETVDWPELRAFFGGWFHQDWDSDYVDEDAAIRDFCQKSAPGDVSAVRAELDTLLVLGMTDDELASVLLHDLGCYYSPARRGQSVAEWLGSVRARLG